MTASRRPVLAAGGIAAGTALLLALAMAPAVAGSTPAAAAQAAACAATAHIDAQWGTGASGGQVVTVTVVNTSPVAGTKWTVTWALGAAQRIMSAWNAVVSVSGTAATAVNTPYNGALAPGASTAFGLHMAGTGPAPVMTCTSDVPVSTASASAPPVTGTTITVTTASNRTSVALHVGDGLVVSLPSMYVPPTVTTPGILAQSSVVGGYPAGQPLVAQYVAVAPGQADVNSITDGACLHQPTPCPSPQIPWTVHVTVS